MALWIMGGYAEFMHLPSPRFLIKLNSLDPAEAAPLADAGLTPYRAIKKALPHLHPGAFVAVLGVGGLGHLSIQILKALSPGARVVAVDITDEKLALASTLGAHHVVDGRGDAVSEILRITGGEGAQAVIDLVGTDATMQTAAATAARKGMIVIVGIGGGTLPYSFIGTRAECTVTNSYWGSYTEFEELLALATQGLVRPTIHRFSLDQINEAMDLLQRGRIQGRAVIVP
jgi:propanol-preferring alcohol dehydrogenase